MKLHLVIDLTSIDPASTRWVTGSFRVLILYEDFSRGIRATGFVRHLGWVCGPGFCPEIKIWRFDVLGIRTIMDAVLRTAKNLDLLIVSAHETGFPFPSQLKAWFKDWLGDKKLPTTMMAGLLNIATPAFKGPRPRAAALQEIANHLGIDLFTYTEQKGVHPGVGKAEAARRAG